LKGGKIRIVLGLTGEEKACHSLEAPSEPPCAQQTEPDDMMNPNCRKKQNIHLSGCDQCFPGLPKDPKVLDKDVKVPPPCRQVSRDSLVPTIHRVNRHHLEIFANLIDHSNISGYKNLSTSIEMHFPDGPDPRLKMTIVVDQSLFANKDFSTREIHVSFNL
jgi:hypothetical protein